MIAGIAIAVIGAAAAIALRFKERKSGLSKSYGSLSLVALKLLSPLDPILLTVFAFLPFSTYVLVILPEG